MSQTAQKATPLLLDLFCGAGGAAMGYHRAGFDIVGVDIEPQPRYPFEFVRADALTFALDGFDAIHASPPCQKWLSLTKAPWMPVAQQQRQYPDFLTPTIKRLEELGTPWVCENVPTSPIRPVLVLCGSSFELKVRRHRHFASNILLSSLVCRHREQGPPLGVYGNSGPKNPGGRGRRYKNRAEASTAMGGLDWMTLVEMKQAIPPAYTEYIGRQLMAVLS